MQDFLSKHASTAVVCTQNLQREASSKWNCSAILTGSDYTWKLRGWNIAQDVTLAHEWTIKLSLLSALFSVCPLRKCSRQKCRLLVVLVFEAEYCPRLPHSASWIGGRKTRVCCCRLLCSGACVIHV